MSNFSFNSTPIIRHSRSRFDLSHGVKTSGNVGTLYPFDVQEVYAGDTFKVNTSVVSRLTSQFLRPVMDNLFLDVYYFFVPSRILFDNFVNVFGENTESPWANTEDYTVPVVSGTVPEKSVGDYLGLPVGIPVENINLLPFRAFAKVYDDWFRDQNNISPMHIQKGSASVSESFNSNDWAPNNYFGKCPKVAKMHDYFTSCLPAPQKGSAVDLPLTGNAPIIGSLKEPARYLDTLPNSVTLTDSGYPPVMGARDLSAPNGGYVNGVIGSLADEQGRLHVLNQSLVGATPVNFWNFGMSAHDLDISGLQADLSSVNSATVNDLRFAFQYQKMLERDARSGTRYIEYLQSHFGVMAGDYRLQRSEFLGGRRTPISIHQVTQTTGANSDSSPLAEVAAFSLSNGNSRYTKGFVENGYVIGVFCVRQFHSYQQGVERFWKRSKRTDFFDPVFSHIGEQPVYKTELYGSADSDSVFGYNEAWADLRYRPTRITGQMRSGVQNSLDIWHFGDYYSNAPTLSAGFIEEVPDYVDRAITVESTEQDQFIFDFYMKNIAYRTLPTYSVPSLIDHD